MKGRVLGWVRRFRARGRGRLCAAAGIGAVAERRHEGWAGGDREGGRSSTGRGYGTPPGY